MYKDSPSANVGTDYQEVQPVKEESFLPNLERELILLNDRLADLRVGFREKLDIVYGSVPEETTADKYPSIGLEGAIKCQLISMSEQLYNLRRQFERLSNLI